MTGNIVANVVAAALDAFVFTLLIPFLNALFKQTGNLITTEGWIGDLQKKLVGAFLDQNDLLGSLKVFIIAIVVIVAIKNVFLWIAGQLGASLQEYVTRDLRDNVFRHLQRLPLGYFHSTKVGQIIARVLTDTDQTKNESPVASNVFAPRPRRGNFRESSLLNNIACSGFSARRSSPNL